MDWTLCSFPSRIRSTSFSHRYQNSTMTSSADDEQTNIRPSRSSHRNNQGQLCVDAFPPRDYSGTVRYQLLLHMHSLQMNLPSTSVSQVRRHTISQSAHEFPPALSCFAGLESHHLYFFTAISFGKLHVLDLGITRHFWDMINTMLQNSSNLALSRSMCIGNDRFSALTPSARPSAYRPFRSNIQDSQAGMSGKRGRNSVPFLWLCIIGLSSVPPIEDPLLLCAVRLNRINDFICTYRGASFSNLSEWQWLCFEFETQFYTLFQVDISTKLHWLMRNFPFHFHYFGCIRRE